jgi:hypothetical protein
MLSDIFTGQAHDHWSPEVLIHALSVLPSAGRCSLTEYQNELQLFIPGFEMNFKVFMTAEFYDVILIHQKLITLLSVLRGRQTDM